MKTLITQLHAVDEDAPRRSTPLIAGEVRAGFPSPADDYVEASLDLNEHLITRASSTFIVRVKGHSMERHGIYSGDLLIVDRSLQAAPGDIVIMAVDGELTCKQLVQIGKRFYLSSGREEFPPIALNGAECHCWGVVTYNVHALRCAARSSANMIALVDCNNFYASCERVFRPDWEGRPLAVLSNNDGCVIARSEEAKTLGIAMGVPMFQIPHDLRRSLVLVSSNYTLYGDMSHRVTTTLRQFTPDVEIYSIDESFLGLEGFDDIESRCRLMRTTVRRNTGIPVSVGVSTSRTLAKVANRLAKKRREYGGVCVLEPDSAFAHDVLSSLPVDELWGVSGRLAARLAQIDITTAWQLREADPKRIRQRFSVVQERLVYELRGVDCIDTDDYGEPKKNIMTSRSFGQLTSDHHQVASAIRAHATRGAEKLRKQGILAQAIQVHLKTNKHRDDLEQYYPSIVVQLPYPSSDAFVIAAAANAGLKRVWRGGYRFMKAGVMMIDIVQRDALQHDIFDTLESDTQRDRADKLNTVIDQLNAKMGRGTVRIGGTGGKAPWKLKAELLTPRYTSQWDELPVVRT